MARTKRLLSFDEANAAVALWQNKERQLAEVRSMFAKREVTNLTRIRLNQKIITNPARRLGRRRKK